MSMATAPAPVMDEPTAPKPRTLRSKSGMPLTVIKSPAGVPFTVHADHAPRFTGFLKDLEGAGYKLNGGESGGYNPRNIAGTNKPSLHSHGAAIDINWNANGRGMAGNLPANVGDIAKKHGLDWGGTWKNPDPMHFQVAGFSAPHDHGVQTASHIPTSASAPMTPMGMASPPPSMEQINAWRQRAMPLLAANNGTPTTGWGAVGRIASSVVGNMWADKADAGLRSMQQSRTNALDTTLGATYGNGMAAPAPSVDVPAQSPQPEGASVAAATGFSSQAKAAEKPKGMAAPAPVSTGTAEEGATLPPAETKAVGMAAAPSAVSSSQLTGKPALPRVAPDDYMTRRSTQVRALINSNDPKLQEHGYQMLAQDQERMRPRTEEENLKADILRAQATWLRARAGGVDARNDLNRARAEGERQRINASALGVDPDDPQAQLKWNQRLDTLRKNGEIIPAGYDDFNTAYHLATVDEMSPKDIISHRPKGTTVREGAWDDQVGVDANGGLYLKKPMAESGSFVPTDAGAGRGKQESTFHPGAKALARQEAEQILDTTDLTRLDPKNPKHMMVIQKIGDAIGGGKLEKGKRWTLDKDHRPIQEDIPGSVKLTAGERTASAVAKMGLDALNEAQPVLVGPTDGKGKPTGDAESGWLTRYAASPTNIPGIGQVGGVGKTGRAYAAMEGAVMDLNFYLSGKSVSDKEREAFMRLYQPRPMDSQTTIAWKMDRLRRYFKIIQDVRDGHQNDDEKVRQATSDMVREGEKWHGADGSAKQALSEARQAIKEGKPRDKVIERLRQNGIDPRGL